MELVRYLDYCIYSAISIKSPESKRIYLRSIPILNLIKNHTLIKNNLKVKDVNSGNHVEFSNPRIFKD